MSEAQPTGPARRPILGSRHGAADRLLSEYAAHEWAAIREETWFGDTSAMFSLRISSGRAPSAETLARVQHTGRVLSRVRRDTPVHYTTLRREYVDALHPPLGALRAALEQFARTFDGMARAQEYFAETVDS